MRRTSIKSRARREWEAQRAARSEREPKPLHRLERTGVYEGGTTGPAPKGERAKPGKRAPTKAEREWLDAIVRFGCIACWLDGLGHRPPAVHHILRGGRRMGHLHSIGLCDPGHHQNGAALGMVSRHPWKARFEAKYGTELELLARLRAEIGWKE
jgi:hypothetical protein